MRSDFQLGILGQTGHGKAALTAAIFQVQADQGLAEAPTYEYVKTYRDIIDRTWPHWRDFAYREAFNPDIYIQELKIADHKWSVTYARLHADFVRYSFFGHLRPDVAILVVSALEGPLAETRAQLYLSRIMGVQRFIVFLNKCDQIEDADLLEVVELEVRDFLREHGLEETEVPIVRGSATAVLRREPMAAKPIWELLSAVDALKLPPDPEPDHPLLIEIHAEDFFSRKPDRQLDYRIVRGRVRPGDAVEIVGRGPAVASVVTSIRWLRRRVDVGETGATVELTFADLPPSVLRSGRVVASPGRVQPRTRFQAEVYARMPDDDGLNFPILLETRLEFWLRGDYIPGMMHALDGRDWINPGDHRTVTVELCDPIAVEAGLGFSIRHCVRGFAIGVITRILDEVDVSPQVEPDPSKKQAS